MALTAGLDMTGHIDDVFVSTPAERVRYDAGSFVDGIWQEGAEDRSSHKITLQALSDRELESMFGAERLTDVRKLYVNDTAGYTLTQQDFWEFQGVDGQYKVISMDFRPWRNYAKLIVSRKDEQT